MPKAKASRVPRSAYYILPVFGLWTAANVYMGLGERYGYITDGPMLGPRKTKFMIDESKRAKSAAGSGADSKE